MMQTVSMALEEKQEKLLAVTDAINKQDNEELQHQLKLAMKAFESNFSGREISTTYANKRQ